MANLSFRVYAKHSDTCDCTPTNRCAFYRGEWDIAAVFRYLQEAIDYAQYCNRNGVSVEIRNRAWGSPRNWIVSEYPAKRGVRKVRTRGVAEAMAACDEIEAGVARIRELLRDADAYRRHAFYQSSQSLYENTMLSLERAWLGFADILQELPE
jgi:hypothetical protein